MYAAPAAACAAEVLLALAKAPEPLSMSALAKMTGRTKSLVFRVIRELEVTDCVRVSEDGRYSLGISALELGGPTSRNPTTPLRREMFSKNSPMRPAKR